MPPVTRVASADEPTVSILIVAARKPERLVRCLRAVSRHAPSDLAYEVVVVLNAAEPGMREQIERDVEGVRLVESEVPLGLAGGANLGASRASGRLLLLLHDDTEVGADWLMPLVRLLDGRPEVGAVGSAVLNLDGTLQTAGHVLWRNGATAPRWLRQPPPVGALGDPCPADYCASACLLVRRAAWDAVGGLDEGFHPAYYVDVDLAMSLRSRGYIVLCEPASRVRHERGGSSASAFRMFLAARHRERFVGKWAADLAHQQPEGHDAESLARADRATERRAAAVAKYERQPSAPVAPGATEDALTRLRRERALLQRDVAVKHEFIGHAQELLDHGAATRERLELECAELQGALAASNERAAAARRAQGALTHEHGLVSAEREALAQRLAAADVELEALRARARTLAAIESGGWWRLRARLMPLLRLAEPVRGAVGRHRGQ